MEKEEIKYEQKIWISDRKYLAVLNNALVVVTLDQNGKPERYAIFGNKEPGKK